MTDKNIKLTKEEKIQKAKKLLKEVENLELNDEELKEIIGGVVWFIKTSRDSQKEIIKHIDKLPEAEHI